MRVRVRLFAGLRERVHADELEVELGAHATVADLKLELARLRPELGSLAHVQVALDRTYANDATPVLGAREIALIPPVSGGSGEDERLEAGVFELSAGPLDPAACQRRVEHPSCGGVVLFSGEARETSRGKRVLRLEYEAYEPMLAPEMARIFERCRAACGPGAAPRADPRAGPGADAGTGAELGAEIGARARPGRRLRMLVVHRSGVVRIGEPAVVVAVASPHRDAAFLAARFLIDELKLSLPVWKRESYPDGETWVGDRP